MNLLHEIQFPSRWGDMDALGHVNNTLYFRYFEHVRTDWLKELGYMISLEGEGQGPVIIDAHCQFLLPAVYPVTLSAIMYGGEAGRSSFDTFYELRNTEQPEILFCKGSSRIVWIDYRQNKSIPIPDKVRALLPCTPPK